MLDFLGIGAPKAGTTYLFKMLAMHPEVYFPLGKECHYWDTPKSRHNGLKRHYLKTFRESKFAEANGWKCGEITPKYSALSETMILEIKATFPDVRIFYIERPAVDRIWSAVRRRMRLTAENYENRDRAELCDLVERQIAARFDKNSIQAWCRHFTVHEMKYEDLQSQPAALLDDLCRFLGISDDFYGRLPADILKRKVYSSGALPPPPELVELVQARLA